MVVAESHLRSCSRVSCASVGIPDLRSALRSAAAGHGRGSQTSNNGLKVDWPPRPRWANFRLIYGSKVSVI